MDGPIMPDVMWRSRSLANSSLYLFCLARECCAAPPTSETLAVPGRFSAMEIGNVGTVVSSTFGADDHAPGFTGSQNSTIETNDFPGAADPCVNAINSTGAVGDRANATPKRRGGFR